MHAKALDVLQIGGQLLRVSMDHHIYEHGQEVISTCSQILIDLCIEAVQ